MKKIILGGMALLLIITGILAVCSKPALAATQTDKVSEFYKGKKLTFYVPVSPGGTADLFARLIARYLPAVMDLDTVIVVNETGASGMVARNKMAKSIKPDGLSLVVDPIGAQWPSWAMNVTGVDYDITKFKYIAAVKGTNLLLVVAADGPYKTAKDLQDAKKELLFSSTSAGSMNALAPMAVIEILGLNGRIITGYKGTAERLLGILNKEVSGAFVPTETALEREKQGLRLMFLASAERDKNFPDIPCLADVIKLTDYHRSLLTPIADDGRLIAAPPGTPDENIKYLRDKFAEVFAVKKFQADLGKTETPWLGFWTGEEMAAKAMKLAEDKKVYLKLYQELSKKLIK